MENQKFIDFYNEYSRSLWLYIFKLCSDEHLTGDIVQESFLKIIKANQNFKNDLYKKPYLYKTATNLLIDLKRRKKVKDKNFNYQIQHGKFYSHDFYNIEIEQIFQFLKIKEKSLLWLAYVEGYSHQEIGEMLGLKTKSVKTMLNRAKKKVIKKTNQENIPGRLKHAKILYL